jgi:DNA-binding transcriptional regulator PaaX
MPNKLEVLTLFEERRSEALDHKSLMEKFDLAADAAFHRLSRLHKQGLIKLTSKQGGRFYSLTENGRKRLKWLKQNIANGKESIDLGWLIDKNKPTRQRETAGSFLFGKK